MSTILCINKLDIEVDSLPTEILRNALRRAGYFSVRFGSDSGETGAAAILLDGRLVSSDTILVGQAVGREIETIEGLTSSIGELHPIQRAFMETGAYQSGYSTPAMILAAKALLDQEPNPTEAQVRDALSGILDRETGYIKPVEAILRAAAAMRGEAVDPYDGPQIVDASYLVETPEGTGMDDNLDLAPGGSGTGTAVDIRPQTDITLRSGIPETEVVGKSATKVDALQLLKGNPAFVDDFEKRGMLFGKLLTSPHAHAHIIDIDDKEASAIPGVRAIIHFKNINRIKYASGGQSYPNPPPLDQVSFDNKVRHVGDRVAAIAADSPEIAEEALKRIRVEYEVLPAVFDENEATKPGAPVIHDEEDTEDIHDATHNIVHHIEAETGDVARGYAEADHVFEHTYRVHQVHAAPIEPHIAISWWDENERLVIRTSTQVPFHVRRMVAPLLGLPVSRIRVIKPRIGGGFGVKQEMLLEDIVGHLTIATGRPVRLELTREEEFQSSRTRHPQTVTYKSGIMNDGTLHSQTMRVIGNTGAYGTHGLTVQTVTGVRGLSSYNCPNRKFDCDVVYTNLPVPGAYRGYGGPQALFALECHMDEIAHALDLDPIAFRKQNWVQAGDTLPIAPLLGEGEKDTIEFEPVIQSCGLNECFNQGMESIGWSDKFKPGWHTVEGKHHVRRGLGAAMCMHGTAIPGLDMGAASIKINDDGSFNVLVGATDLGTGSDTVLAQMAAEVLGVSLDDVIVYSSDTDFTPFDVGAYASSTTYVSGTAVVRAAEQVRERLREVAAEITGVEAAKLDFGEGRFRTPGGSSLHIKEVALRSFYGETKQQISETASFFNLDSPPPFGACFAEVEVDLDTGMVVVTDIASAIDVGRAINPDLVEGQIVGCVAMGIGYALTEEMIFSAEGRTLNASLLDYKIATSLDLPDIKSFIVETVEPSGPFGVKSVGEVGMDPIAPAIANAVFNATGVRIRGIPFTPQRVYDAIKAAD